MMKEIIEDLSKYRGILCSWIGRLKIVKMSILPIRFINLTQFQWKLKQFIGNLTLKFIWKCKGTRITKFWKRRIKLEEELHFLILSYYESTVKQTVLYLWGDRDIGQWTIIECWGAITQIRQRCKRDSVDKGWSYQQRIFKSSYFLRLKKKNPMLQNNLILNFHLL